MQYLCLIYHTESELEAMSDREYGALANEARAHTEALVESGHCVGANALEFVSAATTVRVRRGRVSITDGPFAETKEQLGGYVLIEARDLNEAIRIASTIPSARIGSVEIRPVTDVRTRARMGQSAVVAGQGTSAP